MNKHNNLDELVFIRQIQSDAQLDDLDLCESNLFRLKEICERYKFLISMSADQQGINPILNKAGLRVIFAGPPGVDKAMIALAIANSLELPLYRVDLDVMLSKFIGETEKNLDRLFSSQQTVNSVLFFDEADSLFGKRTQVSSANDRFANLEVSYILSKLDDFKGVVIFSTNAKENLDSAFVRRFHYIIDLKDNNKSANNKD